MTGRRPEPFRPGATAVRRDVHAGRVWTAMPQRVIDDTGDTLTLAHWPGIAGLAPTSWIDARRTRDDATRKSGLDDLASGTWTLAPHRWERTELLSRFLTGEHFSVHCFQDAATHTPLHWYVNFEVPHRRRPGIGIDTMDLAVDLVVEPDLSAHRWKDEDEYEQLRRLGVVDERLHGAVDAARERALGLLQDRAGPFAGGWPAWTPDPSWPLPELPLAARDFEGGADG
ncbi:DUF402 domain-containing protein [Kitasatospora sp. NPDC048722]|uniref:DUF402 domain-containing protein n=1 Tax=Kitasatospora sp. NPDC048722 TaxID=3155639 RepID=UPI0034119ACB